MSLTRSNARMAWSSIKAASLESVTSDVPYLHEKGLWKFPDNYILSKSNLSLKDIAITEEFHILKENQTLGLQSKQRMVISKAGILLHKGMNNISHVFQGRWDIAYLP